MDVGCAHYVHPLKTTPTQPAEPEGFVAVAAPSLRRRRFVWNVQQNVPPSAKPAGRVLVKRGGVWNVVGDSPAKVKLIAERAKSY